MKKLSVYLPVIIMLLIELTVGIFLFIAPEKFTKYSVIAFGIALLVGGILLMIRYIKGRKDGSSNVFIFVISVLALFLGVLCVAATDWVMGIFPVMALIYGIYLVVSGVYKIGLFLDVVRLKVPYAFILLISGILAAACGALIILNPFAGVNAIWIFTGIVLIVEAVIDLIDLVVRAVTRKKTEE